MVDENLLFQLSLMSFDPDFYSFTLLRLPFDWKTLYGYIFVLAYELIANIMALLIGVIVVAFYAGSCWFFVSVALDIMKDLFILDEKEILKRNDVELMELFCKIIKFYTDTKGLSINFRVDMLFDNKNK